MEMVIWIVVFVVSLIVLIKSADYFTTSAERIGLYFGLPAFVVGITIVALGTSLPELVASIFAVINGASEIVVANVVGSNITNIFLVLGVAAIVGKKMKITYELIHVDLPFLVGSAFILAITLWDGIYTIGEAVLCLVAFFIYIIYMTTQREGHGDLQTKKVKKKLHKKHKNVKDKLGMKVWFVLVFGCVGIYFGAEYTIKSVIELSGIFGIATEVIALSVIALGTSLPELVTSIVAAKKGLSEIAVGNVLGSNIFNTLFVMGIPALIGELVIPNSILTFSLPVMIGATLLYFFITQDKLLVKWEGWILLVLYVLFIAKIFAWF